MEASKTLSTDLGRKKPAAVRGILDQGPRTKTGKGESCSHRPTVWYWKNENKDWPRNSIGGTSGILEKEGDVPRGTGAGVKSRTYARSVGEFRSRPIKLNLQGGVPRLYLKLHGGRGEGTGGRQRSLRPLSSIETLSIWGLGALGLHSVCKAHFKTRTEEEGRKGLVLLSRFNAAGGRDCQTE